MNKLLLRQLTKLGLSESESPTVEQWRLLLEKVGTAYDEFDVQRTLQENILDVSTKEMERLYEELEIKSQSQISEQKVQLKTVMESVPCFVIWVDQELRILGSNKQANETASQQDLTQFKLSDVQALKELSDFVAMFFVNSGQDEGCQVKVVRNNEAHEHRFVMRKFVDGSKAVIVGLDISEDIRRQIELDNTRTKAVSQSRMAALGEMAAGMAHEINNPLAVISALVQQLEVRVSENHFDPAEFQKKLSKVVATTERIKKIIKGLRTFARDGENDPFLPVSLKTIVDESLELCVQRFKAHGVELRLDPIPESMVIDCRATQISQVILNLLGNARDAVETLEDKWVQLRAHDDGDSVKIFITDSGNGIPEEIANKMMNPFFTTKEVGVGTGLGLSISKGIIDAHKGRLYVDHSSLNTRFVIQLPKKIAQAA